MTAATDASDYINLVRQRCMAKILSLLVARARKFLGESSIDGLQLTAMKTACDAGLVELSKRGYCRKANVVISATDAERRIGHATLALTASPADELVQLAVRPSPAPSPRLRLLRSRPKKSADRNENF